MHTNTQTGNTEMKFTDPDYDFQVHTRNARIHLMRFWAAHAKLLAILAASQMSGCALAPNTIRTEAQHLSHISQHFGAARTNFGSQMLSVVARWQRGGAYLDLGEGYNLSSGMGVVTGTACAGAICGPREITTVSVGYEWQIH